MAKRKYYHDINQDLHSIIEQNPNIALSSVELFSKVAYPIAILEIETTEKTYEDFDFIPFTVLNFVNAGVVSANEIAELTGLSVFYSQEVLDLLTGYGYLNSSGITEMGLESLKEKKMIKITYHAKQRFQADALTGDLLCLSEQTREIDQKEVKSINDEVPIVPHIAGVSEEQINKQLTESNLQNYLRYSGKILNANVVNIGRVQCIDLVYIEAYMLKMYGVSTPFIMIERHERSKESYKPIFQWSPIRLPNEQAGIKYGFSKSVPCYSNEACSKIDMCYELVKKRAVENRKVVIKTLNDIYPFNFPPSFENMGSSSFGLSRIEIKVSEDSFKTWDPFILQFLEYFDQVEGFIYLNSKFNGLVLHFVSEDPKIIYYSKAWKETLENFSSKKERAQFVKSIREHMNVYSADAFQPFDFSWLDDIIDYVEFCNPLAEYEEDKVGFQ